jgi:hypothetical protein
MPRFCPTETVAVARRAPTAQAVELDDDRIVAVVARPAPVAQR